MSWKGFSNQNKSVMLSPSKPSSKGPLRQTSRLVDHPHFWSSKVLCLLLRRNGGRRVQYQQLLGGSAGTYTRMCAFLHPREGKTWNGSLFTDAADEQGLPTTRSASKCFC